MAREANMSRQHLEEALINAAIKIGSEQGIEKIKTRAVEAVSGLNQAYLYQCYSSLDDLIRCAYIYANTQIIEALLKWMPLFREDHDMNKKDVEGNWLKCWRFLMDNIDLCRYCLRLRFSSAYEETMAKEKLYIIENYMAKLDPETAAKFKNREKISCYVHVFDVVKMFLTKIADGEIEDCRTTAMEIYSVVSYAFSYESETE